MMIKLQNNVIYGPVNSRRLGTSLGINILSSEKKVCNFNCVYCQYGWTKLSATNITDKSNFIGVNEVLVSVEKALSSLSPSPNYITFSGNGESTLHPYFDSIVDGTIKLRNEFSTDSKIAILSNSTGAIDADIRKTLSKLDIRIMKLDCGNEKLFKLYNRPALSVSLESIIDGLSKLKDVSIQTLFCLGEHGNTEEIFIQQWIEKLEIIKPKRIQIYTLDRGYPSDKIYPVEFQWLYELEKKLLSLGFKSKAYI